MTPVAYGVAHVTLHIMLNPPIYGMLCFALSVLRTRITKLTFLMFYSIGDIHDRDGKIGEKWGKLYCFRTIYTLRTQAQ